MDIKKIILIRFRIWFLIILFFSLAIIAKVSYIQIIQGNKWRSIAKTLTLEYRPIKATRGNIYSFDNSLLATSLPFYKVALDPCVAEKEIFEREIKNLSKKLSTHFKDRSTNSYEDLIRKARNNKKRYITINKKKINYNERKQMLNWPLFNLGKYKGGAIFEKEEKRYLPLKSLASRTIGHINKNGKGAGLEYTYNDLLKGKDGEGLYQKISGSWKKIKSSSELKPIHGYDIETTIDIYTQDIVENALKKAVIENNADYGCAIVMEVKTGEIKAIVNLSKIREGIYKEIYNYAIGRQRDPGSTFKIVSALALFEETDLQLTDTVDTGDGKHVFFDKTMRDYKSGGFGVITVQEAIEVSSMIGIAKLVENAFGHNPYNYIKYLDKLGFTSVLGFQIIGEAQPIIKTPKQKTWSGITLPWMSTGYEVEVTPLQILTFFNAIANDGKMVKPILLKTMKSANNTVKSYKSIILNRKIASDNTLQKLKTLLEGVVERGSARRIKKGAYKIAGKSGTAQRIEKKGYTKTYYVSFAGYFPAENPKYSCIVAISNPKGYKQYGGDLAAPIVREIADRLAIKDQNLQVELTKKSFDKNIDIISYPRIRGGFKDDIIYLCNQFDIKYDKKLPENKLIRTKIQEDKSLSWIANLKTYKNQVPSVQGLTLKDGIYLLEKVGISINIIGKGNRIKSQSIIPGTKFSKKTKIDIFTIK
ncbi:MAG: transpeptidase family protein [Bacteroidetes bacterium]|nr:transpeptidase family protein [Bacteroidota bacterium]